MIAIDEAVWRLYGEALVIVIRRLRRIVPLPHGLQSLPGPTLLLAERYDESPIGPFISVSIAEPARVGLRPGYFFGIAGVNSAHVRRANCAYWGMPATLGAITWDVSGERHTVRWPERGVVVHATASKRALPFLLPGRSVQVRQDGPVLISSRIRSSLTRKCNATVEVPEDDPCATLAGEHRGFLLHGAAIRRGPARHPIGLLSSLRAPLRAPEPGILGMEQ